MNTSFPDLCFLQVVNVVVWSPCGKFLAAASVGGNLLIWDVEAKLCVDRYESLLSVVIIMHFTCTIVCKGLQIQVVMLMILFNRQKHEKGFTVCGMAWHPSGGRIAYTDTEGCLGLLDGVPSASAPASSSTTQSTKVSHPPASPFLFCLYSIRNDREDL